MKIALAILLACPVVAQAAPSGRLAYIQKNNAIISDASTGAMRILPRSAQTRFLTLSPRGSAVYFVARPDQQPEDGPPSLTGYVSSPPYKVARLLPPRLQGEAPGQFTWSRTGNTLWISGFELSGVYTPVNNSWKGMTYLPFSTSLDEKRVAYATATEIRVRDVKSGRERIFFDQKKPLALFNALRGAKNAKKLSRLREMIETSLTTGDTWAFSSPALSPDGSRLYFASNAGTGIAASGNSTWAIFAADVATGKISALSEVGLHFGRMPETFEVSPDGRRLLYVGASHSSAWEAPSFARVVDLQTQKSREILLNVPESKGKSNMTNGACWSPDGKYVAISSYFYDVKKTTNKTTEDTGWDRPPSSAFTLSIKEAATGQTVRRIAGATQPSWAR